MNVPVQSIAARGPHGGLVRPRPGQAVSDDELIGTWQMFRKTMGLVDSRLAVALTQGDHRPNLVYEAMAKLAASPQRALPMKQLADAIGISTGGLVKLIDRMIHEGLVDRHHSTSDRRVVYAVLTDKGAAHERRSTTAYAEKLRNEFDVLGARGLQSLRRVCEQIEGAVPGQLTTTADGVGRG